MISPDQIDEMDIEQLKAQFSTLMGSIVKAHGDDEEEEECEQTATDTQQEEGTA